MDSDEEFITILSLLYNRMKTKKGRRIWEHPIVKERARKGLFYTIFQEIKNDNEKFFNFVRMSQTTFYELLSVIREKLTKKDTVMRASLSPEEKLVVTLRYLATGCSFADLHYTFRIGKSTASKAVEEVCESIWSLVAPLVIPVLTTEKWVDIATKFEKNANFPHCIGAIDGKHVRIIQPSHSGSMYYNYKNYFSTVLFAMCDSDYLFTYIDVGSYGKSSDGGIFKNSKLYEKLINGTLHIPSATAIGNSETQYPYIIVGDEAFPLSENLLRPYGGKTLNHDKKVFNYRCSRARRYIECCFGIITNKWRILHRPLNVNIDLAEKIIKAICILHNFVRVREGISDEDITSSYTIENVADDTKSRGNSKAISARDKFTNYFVNINPLDWQDKYM